MPGVDRALDRGVHEFEEVAAVVQPGHQILAADLAQLLFQLGVARLSTNHHLNAGFAVVGGRRKVHARSEALTVCLDSGAGQFGGALGALVVLQEVFEVALVGAGDQIDHRHAFELVAVRIIEEFDVGPVGIDMHAVMHVGNRVHGAVEQQLAAFFCFA